MSLTLFVYTFGELKLRKHMPQLQKVLQNKAGKPLKIITMRRVLQIFKTIWISTVYHEGKVFKQIKKLTEIQKKILSIFGPFYENIYNPMTYT